jgi:uncharacterized membrane protein YphA (DoxX/SURF4 family)
MISATTRSEAANRRNPSIHLIDEERLVEQEPRKQVATLPAAEPAVMLAVLRIVIGVLFVWVFFENRGKGLYTADGYAGLIQYYIDSGHSPALWKSVMAVMASHASIAAPIQGVAEFSFGVCLLLGLLTRPVALAAFAFLTSLWVSEWGTAWIWELLVPMMVALCLAIGAAGRRWALDTALAERFPGIPIW